MLDLNQSSILTKFVLYFYREIMSEYLSNESEYYLDLLRFSSSYKSRQEVNKCLDVTNAAPGLIACIKG